MCDEIWVLSVFLLKVDFPRERRVDQRSGEKTAAHELKDENTFNYMK